MPIPCSFPEASAAMLVLVGANAVAAGGHFDVDDTSVLDVGHCQYETWLSRAPARAATLLHLAPACRVGPLEVGASFDRVRVARQSGNWLGTQLKWVADPWIERFSIGLAGGLSFDLTRGGRPMRSVYVPATWSAFETLGIHANAGADWSSAGERTRRLGASIEWAASDRLTVIGERVSFSGERVSRLGARWSLQDGPVVDLSAARVGPGRVRVFTIGLSQDFSR